MDTIDCGGDAPAAVLGEDELGRRQLRLVGPQRPVRVVEVEDGVHLDEVHRGLVVGVDRPHVPPVLRLLLVLVPEEVGEDPLARRHQPRDDVAAEVVGGVGLGVALQLAHEHVHVEDVDAHRAEAGARGSRARRGGASRLLPEADDARVVVDLEHAEAARLGERAPRWRPR